METSPFAGEELQNLSLCSASGPLSREDLYRATPAATRDLGFSGLIRLISLVSYDTRGVWRIYSNPDPQLANDNQKFGNFTCACSSLVYTSSQM
jgi:hypothetical protein